MENFNLVYTKALYLRFCAIYGDKFIKTYHDDDFKSIWYREWSTGLAGIDVSVIKAVLDSCKLNLEWPPSIAEFRSMCERESGFPSLEESFQAAIRCKIFHPIVKYAYDQVGSWAMKNDKYQDLKEKFRNAYLDAVNHFRSNSDDMWKQLEIFNEQKELIPFLSKIPSQDEIKGFRERLKYYSELASLKKENAGEDTHPCWDKSKITMGHNDFDEKTYMERRDYLIKLKEDDVVTLPLDDKYDRIRFIREEIGNKATFNNHTYASPYVKEKVPVNRFNGTKTIYKNWMSD